MDILDAERVTGTNTCRYVVWIKDVLEKAGECTRPSLQHVLEAFDTLRRYESRQVLGYFSGFLKVQWSSAGQSRKGGLKVYLAHVDSSLCLQNEKGG